MENNDMQGLGFLIGFIVGIGLLIIFLKVTKKDGTLKCRYDERQQLARGRGFKYGFFGCIIFDFIYIASEVGLGMQYMDTSLALFLSMMIGAVIYASYSIWHEAYFSLNENPKKVMSILIAASLLNIVCSIYRIHNGLFEHGILTFINGSNLLCAAGSLIVLGVLFVKISLDQRKAEKE